MNVTSMGVIFTSPRVIEACQKMQHCEQFVRACENMLFELSQIPETITEPSDMSRLAERIIEAMPRAKLNLSEVISEVKQSSQAALSLVHASQNKKAQNVAKGKEGEAEVFTVLRQRFSEHDGYTLMNVSTKKHCSDFLLKKNSYTNIRIESKNYEKTVPRIEIDKFINELQMSNEHGVFVSVQPDASIAGKSSIDMEMVPVTNKLIFFLCGTEFLTEVVQIIYKLDRIVRVTVDEETDSCISLDRESVSVIQNQLNDLFIKKSDMKIHLNSCIKILDDMTLDNIKNIVAACEAKKEKMHCPDCNQEFVTIGRFKKHCDEGICKKRKTLDLNAMPVIVRRKVVSTEGLQWACSAPQ